MSVGTYRYGERAGLKGLCIGVTRYPPRGVSADSAAARACYDVWLPLLAPSKELIRAYKRGNLSFSQFATKYRREMQRPDPRHVIETLAAVAQRQRVHVGCYCMDETLCHRSLLRTLIDAVQSLPDQTPAGRLTFSRYSSPACAMTEIED